MVSKAGHCEQVDVDLEFIRLLLDYVDDYMGIVSPSSQTIVAVDVSTDPNDNPDDETLPRNSRGMVEFEITTNPNEEV